MCFPSLFCHPISSYAHSLMFHEVPTFLLLVYLHLACYCSMLAVMVRSTSIRTARVRDICNKLTPEMVSFLVDHIADGGISGRD